jgi:anhydro-N-acetylmuramic acid kinase
MNVNIEKLYNIGSKNQRNIIGLMSGTSLDGLDVAYCTISNFGHDTKILINAFDTIAYNEEIKDKIRRVFAKKEVDFTYLVQLNEWIGNIHGDMVNSFIETHGILPDDVDVIASHGQTVMHVPRHQHSDPDFGHATLQIGDGDQLAVKTGIITISDFRQKHIAAGGEGAPLAVYGDYLMFSKKGEDRIMLNIGGIANFTYLPSTGLADAVFVTDTGPGNTLMDAWMRRCYNLPYDVDGSVAVSGQVNVEILHLLKNHPFFNLDLPKTTGPELFNLTFVDDIIQRSRQTNITHEDIMATLCQFTAETIADAIKKVIGNNTFSIYISGGGAHNQHLVNILKTLLPNCTFDKSDVLGISGDAKEAVLFAVLANETLAGKPIDFGDRQGVPSVCMGKISFPT